MKKGKKEIIEFLIILCITCVIFIPFLRGHYAADTYNIANIGYKEYAIKWSLNDGRLVMAILGLIAWRTNISIEMYVIITLFLALFISDVAVLKLNSIIRRYKQPNNTTHRFVLLSICFVTIFNFMYIENMYFVESVVMALSILLYMLSADVLVQKSKCYIIKSLFLAIIGVICYQGTIGMFIAFLILFTILKNKWTIKNAIIDLLKGALVCSIAVLLNIFLVKLVGNLLHMEQNRLGNIKNILNNIIIIIRTMPDILQNTCNFFPKNFFLFFLTLLTIIVLIYQGKNLKEKNEIWYKYLVVLFVTLAGSNVTYILTLTSFYTGRLRNALGAVIGIIFLLLFVETNLFEKKKILNIVTYSTLFLYVLVTIVNYENIMFEHRKINKLEEKEVKEIETYMEQYEKENNIKIAKIVNVIITNNSNQAYFKEAQPVTYDAVKTNWADDGVINFYTKRKLHKYHITQNDFENMMEQNNKNLEYICKEDALYLKVYVY